MSRHPNPPNRWRPPRGDEPRGAGRMPGWPARPLPRRRKPRRDRRSVVLLLLGSLLGGILLLVWQGVHHLPRIGLTLLAGGLGLSLAVSWARGRRWYVRLGCLVAGLAAAAGAWWFVPTTRGGNLRQVYRLLHEVETLPAGSVREYREHLDARRAAQAEFPAYADDIEGAERAWFRRTADQALRTASRERERDPARAAAALQRLTRELHGLDLAYTIEKEIADKKKELTTEAQRHREDKKRRKRVNHESHE
jgi:hypothetical protein